ncbi:hypothetical protein GGR50DRAFT_659884 [Xylaria sp. CBS 124048]|nr:hypothetical protein GGR50DRAFT_659884 [Xylaria sp. CBS 124048]
MVSTSDIPNTDGLTTRVRHAAPLRIWESFPSYMSFIYLISYREDASLSMAHSFFNALPGLSDELMKGIIQIFHFETTSPYRKTDGPLPQSLDSSSRSTIRLLLSVHIHCQEIVHALRRFPLFSEFRLDLDQAECGLVISALRLLRNSLPRHQVPELPQNCMRANMSKGLTDSAVEEHAVEPSHKMPLLVSRTPGAQSQSTPTPLERLPDQILVIIMKKLDHVSLYRLSKTTPHFLRLTYHSALNEDVCWQVVRRCFASLDSVLLSTHVDARHELAHIQRLGRLPDELLAAMMEYLDERKQPTAPRQRDHAALSSALV